MKKISLLLFACAAMVTSATAQDGTPAWPTDYPAAATGFEWGSFADPVPAAITAAPTAEVVEVEGLFDAAISASFDELWDMIPGDANSIDQIKSGDETNTATATRKEYASWKVAYDDEEEAIVVLVLFDDKATAPVTSSADNVEIMICPYYVMSGYTGSVAGLPYLRFGAKGGHKFECTSSSTPNYFSLEASDTDVSIKGSLNGLQDNLVVRDLTAAGSKDFKRVITIPFSTLIDTEVADAVNVYTDFTPELWKTINGGKGIAFNIKFMDKGNFNGNDDEGKPKHTEYMWSTTDNDIYYGNGAGMGWLKLAAGNDGGDISIDGADISKITIANGVISLEEAANVEIYSTLGALVLSTYDAQVDISGLAAGAYIVKAAGQVAKFVK